VCPQPKLTVRKPGILKPKIVLKYGNCLNIDSLSESFLNLNFLEPKPQSPSPLAFFSHICLLTSLPQALRANQSEFFGTTAPFRALSIFRWSF